MAEHLIMWAGVVLGLPAALVLAALVIAGHCLVRHVLLRLAAASAVVGLVAQAYRNWLYLHTGTSPSDLDSVLWFAKDVAIYLAAAWVVVQTWRPAVAWLRRARPVRVPPPPQYDPDEVAFSRPPRRRPAGLDVPAMPKAASPRTRPAPLQPTPATRARTGARTRPAPLEPAPPKPRTRKAQP